MLVRILRVHLWLRFVDHLERSFFLLGKCLRVSLVLDHLMVLESLSPLLQFVVHYLIVVLHDCLHGDRRCYYVPES